VKATLTALWRLFHALAFYPILIGAFIWLYFKGAHWIYGLMIIAIILIFDPIWRLMGQRLWNILKKR